MSTNAVPTNMELVFAERPEVFDAWVALNTSVKEGMDLRRYELATFAAAQASFELLLARARKDPRRALRRAGGRDRHR